MSDTPETDEFERSECDGNESTLSFSRKLERERDAFEQRLFDVRDVLLDAMPDANAPTKILAEMIVAERDKYQEQADEILIQLGATQERMIDAERWKGTNK